MRTPEYPVVDAHCHAWRVWPYRPAVPDPASRGLVEQLLHEMDRAGVREAAIVCARIDHNPDNNDYVAECVARYPDRLHQLADVDCCWSTEYHAPGAADRLRRAADRYHLRGFTHYVAENDTGEWYASEAGLAFWETAVRLGLFVSLSIPARLQFVVRDVAARFPSLPILCHHMALPRADELEPKVRFRDILASARQPNVYLKLSGFHYASPRRWGFPYPDCEWVVRGLYEHFGPRRLCWGSDFPVVRPWMTYVQALEAVRTHCDFITADELPEILGGNIRRLLGAGRATG